MTKQEYAYLMKNCGRMPVLVISTKKENDYIGTTPDGKRFTGWVIHERCARNCERIGVYALNTLKWDVVE